MFSLLEEHKTGGNHQCEKRETGILGSIGSIFGSSTITFTWKK